MNSPVVDIVSVAIPCPDSRRPGDAACEYMAAAPGVEKVHPGISVYSPELTILDDRGLDGVMYQLGIGPFSLYPGRHLRIGIFGHEDCKRNPVDPESQKNQVAAATARLWRAIGNGKFLHDLGDYFGVVEVAGHYQYCDETSGEFLIGDIVPLTALAPITIGETPSTNS